MNSWYRRQSDPVKHKSDHISPMLTTLFLTKAMFLTMADETWHPSSSLNLLCSNHTGFLAVLGYARQRPNLGTFYWLFPPSGLLFLQIILTFSHLLQSLLTYPLVNDAYSDNHFYDCLPHPLYLQLLFFPFLKAFSPYDMQYKLCIHYVYCLWTISTY